ncbi:hypothetical protein OAL71_01895 [Phycisphaerales bacterium]|nr:hypothetical protein [Phycisphaerales bacterium]RPG15388.1 MAG: hypothetical protein CBB69_009795 [Phycisphaera sp. TMED9]
MCSKNPESESSKRPTPGVRRLEDAARYLQDDRLAQSIATDVHTGRSSSLSRAMRLRNAPSELEGLVKRHLAAMRAASIGELGLNRLRADRLRAGMDILECLDSLEDRFADQGSPYLGSRLAGRAARGQIEPEDRLHLRYHGVREIRDLAAELEFIDVVEIRFSITRSRYGMLETMHGILEGVEFDLRRCPPGQILIDAPNLIRGGDVPLASADEVARLIAGMIGED